MLGVIVALPLSFVGLLALSSGVWACDRPDRSRDTCVPKHRWEQLRWRHEREGNERGTIPRDRMEQRIDEAVALARREFEKEARARIEEARAKAEVELREAAELRKKADVLQELMAEEIVKAKKAQDDAAQHQRDADDRAKQADAAKRAAEDEAKLWKVTRERHEARFIEILAHDPCGAQGAAPASSSTIIAPATH